MTKPGSEKKTETKAPPTVAVVDTGKSSDPVQTASAPSAPAPAAHGKHHKTAKVDTAELEALKTKAGEADKYYDQLLRLRAEFDNYRRRIVQEKQYAELAANEKILQRLLGVLDTFDIAIASAETSGGNAAVVDGVRMLKSQLQAVLKDAGVEEIDAHGKPFDPNFHEAIQQLESKDHEEGTVLQQTRKGYRFKDRLLRAASVVVSKQPEPPPAN